MSGGEPSGALRDIRTLFSDGMLGGLTDRQLLERFVNRRNSSAEDAFSVILQRHGPMVWGVCCRLLADRSAAADAFQATFLVLVRRASAVRVEDSLGPWLYGVCRRVAKRARATSLRRRAHETDGVEAVAGAAADPDHAERLAILDEEIDRLPEHHRAAVILCDLEGLRHEEAAHQLGCPVGTVESRLSRGRQRLRDRLRRRGIAPAVAAIWAETARESSAAMPAELVKRSAWFVTSPPAAGTVPPAVSALAGGVIGGSWLARLKPLVAVAAALILAAVGMRVQGHQKPPDPGPRITVAPVQSGDVTITHSYVGRVLSHHHIEVRAPEAGILGPIPLTEGQPVTRGDRLFQVHLRTNLENRDNVVSIKAPFDGVVHTLPYQQGSFVQKGQALTSLLDNSVMWVYFNVPESRYFEYSSAKLEQHKEDLEIELVLANGKKFDEPGKLGAIGADFHAGSVPFRADFPNPERLLRHGQTGTVLISQVQKNAIVVPQRSTFALRDSQFVYVLDEDNVARRRAIEIQTELKDDFVIKSGVDVGEKIVIDGVRHVHDGDKVDYEVRQPK